MQHRLQLVLLVFCFALPLGAQSPGVVVPRQSAILSGAAARPLFRQCSRAAPQAVTAYWTPTATDTAALEAALPRFLAAQTLPRSIRKHGLSDSYHQLAGFTRGDKKYLYVNGFPRQQAEDLRSSARGSRREKNPFDWRREALVICDGGPQFWGVEYDVQTRTFANLQFNGPPEVER